MGNLLNLKVVVCLSLVLVCNGQTLKEPSIEFYNTLRHEYKNAQFELTPNHDDDYKYLKWYTQLLKQALKEDVDVTAFNHVAFNLNTTDNVYRVNFVVFTLKDRTSEKLRTGQLQTKSFISYYYKEVDHHGYLLLLNKPIDSNDAIVKKIIERVNNICSAPN